MPRKRVRHRPVRSPAGPPRSSPIRGLDRWLTGKERWVLAAIVVLALGIRTAYFLDLRDTAAFRMHEWAESDMNFFDRWGKDIAAGDWLTDQVLHPHHEWHRQIADRYLTDHPEKVAELAPGGQYEDARRELWNLWFGGKRYHQEPLYPYVIGILYALFGANPSLILFGQAVLGSLSVGLIWLIALRLFGRPVALVSALLALLCGPMLFYDAVLLRTTPLVFAGLLLVYLMMVSLSGRGYRHWIITGIVFGAALALKTTFGLLWLGAVALLACARWREPRVLVRTMAVFVAGTFLLLAPFMIRNVMVGVSPLALSSVNSLTFVLGNSVGYQANMGAGGDTDQVARILGETNGDFLPSAVRALESHPSIMSYIRQVAGKVRVQWHWFEFPNNVNYYFYKLHSNTLRLLPVTFLFLSPLAMVGLFLAWPRLRKRITGTEAGPLVPALPLYILIGSLVFTLLISLGLSRYRLPMVVALIPFAAFTLVQIIEWLVERKFLRAAGVILAVGTLALTWTAGPLPGNPPLTRPADHYVSKFYYFDAEMRDAGADNDLPRMTRLFEQVLGYEPRAIRSLGSLRPAQSDFEAQIARFYGDLHSQYAGMLEASGRPDQAAYHRRRGEDLRKAAGVGGGG